jgi:hypothetical protein
MARAGERSGAGDRLPTMLATVVVILSLVVMPPVLVVARWAGRRAANRETIPWRPIFQLVEHRTRCLGHTRARVEGELGPALGIPPWAWGELFALRRPLERKPRAAPPEPEGRS